MEQELNVTGSTQKSTEMGASEHIENAKNPLFVKAISQNQCIDCGGDLEQETYKGNLAVVCSACHIPVVQLMGEQ